MRKAEVMNVPEALLSSSLFDSNSNQPHNYHLAWLYHNITSLLLLQRKGERRSKKSHDPLPSSIDDPIKRGRDKDHVVEGAGKKTKISYFCYVGISLKVPVIAIARLPTFISFWVPKTYQEVQKSFSKQYAIYVQHFQILGRWS